MSRDSRRYKIIMKALTVLLLWSCYLQATFSDTQIPGDFFVFPNLQLSRLSGSGVAANAKRNDIEPAIDLFYSYQENSFLLLIEYFVNQNENEFERLQLGWAVDKNTRFWLGRFHNPLGIWNTDFHHGTYLQTTISRPAITEFEDDSGVIPSHISGLLLEADRYFGESQINTSLALGVAASMKSGSLEPFNLFNPGDETFHENISLRLSYYPQASENRYFGAFVGYSRIKGDAISSSEIKQIQAGVFAVLQIQAVQLRSALFFVENRLSSVTATPDLKGDFINAYVQLEYEVDERWTAFARLEDTFSHENDPYLALFPEFTEQRQLAGVRFDVIPQHAFTLEWRQDHVSAGDINQLVLQWSAFFP